MPRPGDRTERGHFRARVLERNRQAQLANELGAPDQLGIFVRTKEPRDPHKKGAFRPLVHFPLELKLPGSVTLPPIPQEGRGRPSALTNARARLILAVACTGATVEVIAAAGGVTPSTLTPQVGAASRRRTAPRGSRRTRGRSSRFSGPPAAARSTPASATTAPETGTLGTDAGTE